MQNVSRVHVLETFQSLIDDVLLVNVLKNVCSDNCVQVSLHVVEYKVDVSIVLCSDHIEESDDVLVSA